MRKILSLLALVLLSCMGAWAQTEGSITTLDQLSNDKTYTIRSNRRGWWTAMEGSANIWQTNGRNDSNVDFTSGSGKTQNAEDADQQWAILKSENDNYYLYNVGQQKFFASSDAYATRYAKATLDAKVNGGVVLSFDESAQFTGAADSPAVRWAIGKKVGDANQFFGVTNWNGQSWQVFQNTEDYNGGKDEGMYFAIVTAADFNATDKAAALAAIEAFENTPVTFPAAGIYYMTVANCDTNNQPYIYNSIDDPKYTLQSATQPSPLTNGYIWKVVSDGAGHFTSMTDGTGQSVGVNGKFKGRLVGNINYEHLGDGKYYLTHASIGGGHECINRAGSLDYSNNGIRTVTTWTGKNKTDNQWRFTEVELTDKFVYDVVIAAGAPAGAYVEFNGQKALNGGFFVVDGSDFVNPTAATIAGYDADVKVENQTITVTYTQTATSVDVTYNIYVGDDKVASVTQSEFEGVAPTFTFTHPDYVRVTQDVPASITAGVTSYDIKTTYTDALPFKLDGTKYNIKENRNPALWIFYDGSGLKTIANQVPTYANQDNYKWIVGGDWYNGFTLKNVAESKYVTYGAANPANSADAVLTETLGAGAYFDLVQKNGFNYFKIHGTTVDAYISNCGGPGVTKLTNWNSGNNVGDGGSQLLFSVAEDIAAPSFTFTPEEGKYYTLKVKDTDLYVNINTSAEEAKQVVLGTEPEGFRFTATTSGYHVQNVSDKYIGGYTNTWNMNASTPEVWTIEIAEDGIMLHCAQGNMGLDDVAAGKAFYRNKGGVVFIVEEYVAPVTPVAPVEFVSKIKNKCTYALVNIHESTRYYIKDNAGTIAVENAAGVNAETVWADAAQFVAEKQASGVFAFKNVANGQYLAWRDGKGRGANGNKGFVDEVNEFSTWTMHAGTRFPNTFWFVAKRGDSTTDGSLILKGDTGAWDAWGNTENVNTNSPYAAAYSNNWGFVLVDEYVPTTEEIATLQNEIDNQMWNVDRLGYPVSESDEAQNLLNNYNLNYSDGVTADNFDDAEDALEAFKKCTNVVLPEKNQFYQVVNVATNGVLGGGNSGTAAMLGQEMIEAYPGDPDFDLSSLYYYSREGYLVNYDGGRALKGTQLVTSVGTPDAFTFSHEASTKFGTFCIKTPEGKYLQADAEGLVLVDAPNGNATNWILAPYGYMPINVGSTGYATVYLPYTVAAAAEYNIKAVYVVHNEGDILTTSKVTDIHCIPAKTAVIVEAEPNTRCFGKGMGGEEWYPESPEVEAAVRDNALQGTLIAMPKPDNALVFNVKDDVPGFYGFNGDVLAGFKAYYPYAGEAASNGIALRFDDTLTAIESAIETSKGNEIFDLQGRRVLNAKNGIFIQNGKKVVK